MKFYNREKELEILQKSASSAHSGMIIISGRRRIGKSRLVYEFLAKNKGLKILIVPKEEKQVAADFAEILADKTYTPSFNTVKEALEYFFVNSKERILYIDEFPNFLEVNPAIPYELQRLWELYKEKTNKILILSGSYVSMMDKIFTKQKAPLFNRATAKIILPALKPAIIWRIQNDLGITHQDDQIENYCIFGGVPYYYEILEDQTQKGLIDSFFFGVGQLREEGQDILRQEFGSTYKKYFSILEAIGNGLVSAGEIANKVGLRQTTLSKYMQALQNDFKLIGRVVPFDQNPYRSKKGVYFVKDNLLAFWFSYVYGKTQAPAKNELNSFFGKRFEFLCSEFLTDWLMKKGERIVKVGRWWGNVEVEKGKFEQREIDLVIETDEAFYIGECKWSDNKIGEKELLHLKQAVNALKTKKPVRWVLFNKKGFKIAETNEVLLFDSKRMKEES